MRKILLGLLLILSLAIPVGALEITAPEVPKSGQENMPQNTDSFANALLELIGRGVNLIRPELKDAVHVSMQVLLAAMLISLLPLCTEKMHATLSIAGAVTIGTLLFQNTNSIIRLASDTVWEICEYGKLLCPVLTAALAAQGGITASSALCVGTTAFVTLLNTLATRLIIPMVYIFLTFSVANCALGEEILKKFADAIKRSMCWLLKTILMVFTTYMSITGVISGTTDVAALKAAKLTISSVVPVVGGILSDASESVLVGMAVVKNAAGIYGIVAVLAVFLEPFVKVGTRYLLLKASAAICSVFGNKNITALVEDFSAALGLLLAMVASGCMLVLISTVCYLKGMG